MIEIHGMRDSGNCYKPRLLLALLGRPFRHVDVSSRDGTTRKDPFLQLNPNGRVPLLRLEDGRVLWESNAILSYLGENTPFVPSDSFARAQMMQWMFFEQYSHEPHVAVRRSLMLYPERAAQATPERLAQTLQGGVAALGVMETRLANTDWLVGSAPSLADIALFAYTHDAEAGGFNLAAFPGVSRWLDRTRALSGFEPMTWTPDETRGAA